MERYQVNQHSCSRIFERLVDYKLGAFREKFLDTHVEQEDYDEMDEEGQVCPIGKD